MGSKDKGFLGGSFFDLDNDGHLNFVEQAYAVTVFRDLANASRQSSAPGPSPYIPPTLNWQTIRTDEYLSGDSDIDPIGYDTEEEYLAAVEGERREAWREKYRDEYLNSDSLVDPDVYGTESEYLSAVEEERSQTAWREPYRNEYAGTDSFVDPDDYDSEDEYVEALEEEKREAWRCEYRDRFLFDDSDIDPDDYEDEDDYLTDYEMEQEELAGEEAEVLLAQEIPPAASAPKKTVKKEKAATKGRKGKTAMKKSERAKVLMASFDVLKGDFPSNSEELQNAIKQMMGIKPAQAVSMWHSLVENNQQLLATDQSEYGAAYDLTGNMLMELHDTESFTAFEPLFVQDTLLTEAVFEKTPTINYSHHTLRADLLKMMQIYLAYANRQQTGVFDSWEIVDAHTAIKHCDKSFFKYNGSGIPRELNWFFGVDALIPGAKMPINLSLGRMHFEVALSWKTQICVE